MVTPCLVVIGASAGGVEALGAILPALPATFTAPVVVVIHIPPRQPSLLVEVFRGQCALAVREAVDKQPLGSGIVFAPPDYHLLVEAGGSLALSIEPPVNWSRPSIDVLFESAAAAFGPEVVAIVLTGGSADGAAGAKAVRDAGGTVLVQSPDQAEVPIMPASAIALAHPQVVAPLDELASTLLRLQAPRETP